MIGELQRTLAIACKETIDLARDRRAILVILLTAVAAGPLLLMLVLNLAASQIESRREVTLPATGLEHAPALAAFLERREVRLVPAPEDFERQVREGTLDIVLEVDAAFARDVAQGKPGRLRLTYDRSRGHARATIAEVESLIRAWGNEVARGRLLLRGVAPDAVTPVQIDARDLATPQGEGSLILGMIAYYGLFAALMGAMAAALDTTAAERERGSLEPLLTTPASAVELALGKWAALVLLNALVVAITLGGFWLTLGYGPLPPIGVPFLFGARQYAAFLVVLLPMILFAPAVLLYVGLRGRSVKEAQANASVVLFVASILPVVQMVMQRREPEWATLVPIVGQYSLLARVLRGDALPAADVLAASAAPLLLGALALLLTARLLSRETVLAGR